MTAYKTAVRTAFLTVAALLCVWAAGAAEPGGAPLSNADIVGMTRANVAPALIINRIQASPNAFDLSDQAFMDLKANGVADEVLNAMLAAMTGNAANSAVNNAVNSVLSQIPPLPPLGGSAPQTPSQPMRQQPLSAPPSLSLPPLGGGSDWSDFGQDLANLPPPPALPAFSAPPVQQQAFSAPAVPAAQALPPPPAFSAAPSAPSVASLPAMPVMPAMPSLPSAPPPAATVPAPSPMPPPAMSVQSALAAAQPAVAAPAVAGFDARRFDSELAALSGGSPEARGAALAWMLANRQQTLPGLRQALLAAPGPEAQAGALLALGEMNDQQSLPPIRDLLGSPSPLVRKEAAKALAKMNDTLAIGAAEQNLGNPVDPLDGLIHLVGYARLVRASERLGTILSTNASAVNRAAAAAALAEIGPGASVAWPAVQSALTNDADASVRREAARAVARFHDPSSASLLMNACRSDPEVRKVTLEAMAEYPETVEFLVGVVGLGPDQIAPDESEAARAGLAKLTGRNFGLDGAQWSAWLAGNAAVSAGATDSFSTPGTVLAGLPGLSGPSPVPLPAPAEVNSGLPGQVDITALGMIVDPSQIPMAPEVAEGQSGLGGAPGGLGGGLPGAGGGMLTVPGLGLSDARDALPGAGNASGAAGGGLLGGPAVGGTDTGAGVGAGRLPTPAGFEEYADDQMWSGSMPAGGGMGGMTGGAAGMPPPPDTSGMSALPQPSAMGTVPSPAADAGMGAGLGGASGLQLALPPMAGMDSPQQQYDDAGAFDTGALPADPQQWQGYEDAAAGAADAFSAYDDGTGIPADPYADPYAEPYVDGGMAEVTPLDGGGEDYGGFGALPPPPGGGDAGAGMDTLAFPGDTDDFGIGEPMFAGEGDTGGFDAGGFGTGEFDGGTGDFALPPPPGGGTDAGSFDSGGFADGDFDGGDFGEGDFGDFGELPDGDFAETYTDASGDSGSADDDGAGVTEAPAAPQVSFENYDYGEFDDGMSDSDADFASDDFAAFLQDADANVSESVDAAGDALGEAASDAATALSESAASFSEEGTADWAPVIETPPVGEAYTLDPEEAASDGAKVMEWVRGVGLVERDAPATPEVPATGVPAAPAAASTEPLPEPVPAETIVPAPEPSGPPPLESAEQEGGWFYVEPYGEGDSGASSEETPAPPPAAPAADLPVIATDVYELPEPAELIPADPSGRPSRRLRMQR